MLSSELLTHQVRSWETSSKGFPMERGEDIADVGVGEEHSEIEGITWQGESCYIYSCGLPKSITVSLMIIAVNRLVNASGAWVLSSWLKTHESRIVVDLGAIFSHDWNLDHKAIDVASCQRDCELKIVEFSLNLSSISDWDVLDSIWGVSCCIRGGSIKWVEGSWLNKILDIAVSVVEVDRKSQGRVVEIG